MAEFPVLHCVTCGQPCDGYVWEPCIHDSCRAAVAAIYPLMQRFTAQVGGAYAGDRPGDFARRIVRVLVAEGLLA